MSVGRVLGTQDAMPLEFWVAIERGEYLELDDVWLAKADVKAPGLFNAARQALG